MGGHSTSDDEDGLPGEAERIEAADLWQSGIGEDDVGDRACPADSRPASHDSSPLARSGARSEEAHKLAIEAQRPPVEGFDMFADQVLSLPFTCVLRLGGRSQAGGRAVLVFHGCAAYDMRGKLLLS